MTYKLVLGLEVHLHPKTETKMFCRCDANVYGVEPNTHVCPTCLGLPGELPVPNFDAVKKTQLLGLALHSKINLNSRFDRKHYFYPDLPMGFQISQYEQPLCGQGYLDLNSGKRVLIERIHLEMDTAKSIHQHGSTLIDFNKSGMPLIEIVTRPVFDDVLDAVDFCKQIQEIIRTLEIGDADMEKGQMRLEANISMRTEEMEKLDELPDYKVEIKNINSFRFMEKAVKAEIQRQSELLNVGEKVIQENRGYNESAGKTVSQREKEEAHDYRYFPDPDIPPMVFDKKYIDDLKNSLPEPPYDKKSRYIKLGIKEQEAVFLALYKNKKLASTFEELVKSGLDAKKVASLMKNTNEVTTGDIKARLDREKGLISGETELQKILNQVISENQKAVDDYKKGNTNSLEFIIGQIMRVTKGKAEITKVRELLKKYFQG